MSNRLKSFLYFNNGLVLTIFLKLLFQNVKSFVEHINPFSKIKIHHIKKIPKNL